MYTLSFSTKWTDIPYNTPLYSFYSAIPIDIDLNSIVPLDFLASMPI